MLSPSLGMCPHNFQSLSASQPAHLPGSPQQPCWTPQQPPWPAWPSCVVPEHVQHLRSPARSAPPPGGTGAMPGSRLCIASRSSFCSPGFVCEQLSPGIEESGQFLPPTCVSLCRCPSAPSCGRPQQRAGCSPGCG